MLKGLNIGSGQRRFETVPNVIEWINIDCVSRPPDQVPDIVCDVGRECLPIENPIIDYVVLHQVYEHFGLSEGHGLIAESLRVMKPGGSLILTVPHLKRLAEGWISGRIDDYIYAVNLYGAYQGEPGDRHAWGFTTESLIADLRKAAPTASKIVPFDWREIPAANIARDWYIAGVEVVK